MKSCKPKLNIDEQIEDLKNKNIKFNICNEKQAKEFLSHNNYYFKLKAYLRVYEKYNSSKMKGKYVDVDFAYLIELSTLDMYLRKEILSITLDIEHYLKVRLLKDVSNNPDEDGYNIVQSFFKGNPEVKEKTIQKTKNSYCSRLIDNNKDHFSIWVLVEILSFGDFINLYEHYYNTYNSMYKNKYSLKNDIKPVKLLRNAAAHNNCLINTLRDNNYQGFSLNRSVNTFIAKLKTCSNKVQNKKMGCRVVHDFTVMLYVFYKLTEDTELHKSREYTLNKLKKLLETRFKKHKDYFEKNALLETNLDFVKNIIDKMLSMCV